VRQDSRTVRNAGGQLRARHAGHRDAAAGLPGAAAESRPVRERHRHARPRPGPGGEAAPIIVKLREQPVQVYTFGLGISANTGPRASVEHVYRRFFGHARHVAQQDSSSASCARPGTARLSTHPGEPVPQPARRRGRAAGIGHRRRAVAAPAPGPLAGDRAARALATSPRSSAANARPTAASNDDRALGQLPPGAAPAGQHRCCRPMATRWRCKAASAARTAATPAAACSSRLPTPAAPVPAAGPLLVRPGALELGRSSCLRRGGPRLAALPRRRRRLGARLRLPQPGPDRRRRVGSGPALLTSQRRAGPALLAALPSLWGAVFVDAGRAGSASAVSIRRWATVPACAGAARWARCAWTSPGARRCARRACTSASGWCSDGR
jgi:hypothetical protein